MSGDKEAAFTVRDPVSGHEYKVWADGQIEGFGGATLVINKIPALIAEAVDEALFNAAQES